MSGVPEFAICFHRDGAVIVIACKGRHVKRVRCREGLVEGRIGATPDGRAAGWSFHVVILNKFADTHAQHARLVRHGALVHKSAVL